MRKVSWFLMGLTLVAAACGGKTTDVATAGDGADTALDAAVDVAQDATATGCAACTGSQFCEPATATCKDRVDEVTAAGQRTGCAFGAGDKADRTIGKEWPVGDAIPIKHFVIVMMENRSFDSYFGAGS